MTKPIGADVVNAFLVPALELLRTHLRESRIGPLTVTDELPPTAQVSVDMIVHGNLEGPVRWSFDDRIARVLANAVGLGSASVDPGSPECLDALGEIANTIAGNATGPLLEAGYRVELVPPTPTAVSGVLPAVESDKVLHVTLLTPAGDMKMSFGLRVSR